MGVRSLQREQMHPALRIDACIVHSKKVACSQWARLVGLREPYNYTKFMAVTSRDISVSLLSAGAAVLGSADRSEVGGSRANRENPTRTLDQDASSELI